MILWYRLVVGCIFCALCDAITHASLAEDRRLGLLVLRCGLGVQRPLVGVDLYGERANRLHLHAEWLQIVHPVTGQKMTFKALADFCHVFDPWASRTIAPLRQLLDEKLRATIFGAPVLCGIVRYGLLFTKTLIGQLFGIDSRSH